MRSLVIALLGILAVAAVELIRWWWRRRSASRHMGFREAVRKPKAWLRMVGAMDGEKAAVEAEELTDSQLRQCVEDLLEERRWNRARLRLLRHGGRVVPELMEALHDPRFRFDRGGDPLVLTPCDVVLEVLQEFPSPELVPPLARLVWDRDAGLRKQVARTLARIGTREAIVSVRAALTDDDDFVRSYAMMGLLEGLKERRQHPEFLAAAFETIVPLLARFDNSVSGRAPECLLAIDRERAIPILLSAPYWSAGNHELHHIIDHLNKAGAAIPESKLLPLLAELRPKAQQYPANYCYGGLLVALARLRHPQAPKLIHEALEWKDSEVVERAAKALAALHGLPDVHGFVFDRLEEAQDDLTALPAPVRNYLLVRFFTDEVNNGGYPQFYFNSSGDYAGQTVTALEEVGATSAARFLRQTNALFGKQGPSPSRETRQKQLARIADRLERLRERYEKEFYSREENTEKLLQLYAVKHREHFAAARRSCFR